MLNITENTIADGGIPLTKYWLRVFILKCV